MDNLVASTKPWKNQDGKPFGDKALSQISKSWDAETWEQYLTATVDVERAEDESLIDDFESLLEESSEALWDGPLHVPEPVKRSIEGALKLLTKKQKEAIWLIYWRGLSLTGASRKLEICRKSVLERIDGSLNKIERLLKKSPAVSSYLIGGSKNFDPKPRNQHEQILEIYFQDLKGSYLK